MRNKPWPYLDLPRGMMVVKHWWTYVPGTDTPKRSTMPGHEYTHLDDLGRLERAIASRRRMHVGPYGHQKIRFRWWLDDHRRRATMFLRATVLAPEKPDDAWE